ncbi:MAG TPA: site-2 protease family protein [Bryobacteraceae bacterium]|nr:site-2 protease family protein [Bryobacteraceae bacterium]
MRSRFEGNAAARVLIVLLLTLPILVLFLLPTGAMMGAVWFWLVVALTVVLIWNVLGRPANESVPAFAGPRPLAPEEYPPSLRSVLQVDEAVEMEAGVQVFRGALREDADRAFADLKQGLGSGTVPLLQDGGGGRTSVVLLPKPVEEAALERRVRPWLHWLLFGLTFLTTTFAGAAHRGVNLLREPSLFTVGLPYSVALLAILGCHELGHYFTARYHRMSVTPPFFIPIPFALGTFGAFIQMRSPAENRKALFDVAVAGPLAGLVIAIPALYFGLKSSEVVPADSSVLEGMRGSISQASILMSIIVEASLGQTIRAGDALRLSPLAFAGWLGLLVTALNLVPVGQLDGGHIARALFGTRIGMVVSSVAVMSLFLLALFVWPGLMMWAIIVFFIAGRGTPPLNDVSPLSFGRKLLGLAAFVILALILIPMPEGLHSPEAQGMRCPYL